MFNFRLKYCNDLQRASIFQEAKFISHFYFISFRFVSFELKKCEFYCFKITMVKIDNEMSRYTSESSYMNAHTNVCACVCVYAHIN